MPDELYWSCTPVECGLLLDAIAENKTREERAAALRAGLVASAVYNSIRTKRSDKVWTPYDFVRKERSDDVVLPPSALPALMDAFVAGHNKRFAAKSKALPKADA